MIHAMYNRFLYLLFFICISFFAQSSVTSYGDSIPNILLNELVVYAPYPYKNQKERDQYKKLEVDLRKVYPLIKIIKAEYERVNKEMMLYDSKTQREYLKWYEKYAKDNYMPYMNDLSISQARLFLKLIDRELGESPYELIKRYRNGFRAVFWQGAAFVFTTNLKSEYQAEENPMIEHILLRIESEDLSTQKTTN
jgi:hypothetical protein